MTALSLQLRELHPLGGGKAALLSPFRLAETWTLVEYGSAFPVGPRPRRVRPADADVSWKRPYLPLLARRGPRRRGFFVAFPLDTTGRGRYNRRVHAALGRSPPRPFVVMQQFRFRFFGFAWFFTDPGRRSISQT